MTEYVQPAGLVILSAIMTFAASAFWFHKKRRELDDDAKASAVRVVDSRVSDLEQKLAVVTAAVTPLSAAMQAVFIKELTHFHTPELDALLVKVGDDTITDAEEPRLFALLSERATELNGRIPDSERDVAIMFPLMRKRVKAEKLLAAVDIQVVSTPANNEK